MKQINYFATFITGCQQIIASRLQRFSRNQLTVDRIEDGVVVFDSCLSPNQLSELRFFNNVYALLATFDAPKDIAPDALPVPERLSGTFTVRYRIGSQPQSVPPEVTSRVAKITGATPTSHLPDHQFLLWQRTDGTVLWGRALPRAGFKTRRIEPGELRPELAHILGLAASVDAKHNVLDPFAGYGAIARECLQGFHAAQVIAVESSERLIPHLKSIPHLVALHGDARKMEDLQTRSVDRVITDPPWGQFNQMGEHELRDLYAQALSEIHRVLRAKGCAVILTSVPWLPELAQAKNFTLEKRYDILVSGKKASIYKLRKHEAVAEETAAGKPVLS